MCMTTRIDREARKKVRKEQIGCGGYENTRQTHWQRSPNVIQFSRREIHPGGSSLSLSLSLAGSAQPSANEPLSAAGLLHTCFWNCDSGGIREMRDAIWAARTHD
jgi:hypothetical protein